VTTTATLPVESTTSQRVPARSAERAYGLDVLRVLAICGVVAIHVVSVDEHQATSLEQWAVVTVHRGFIWAVPVFVMISGALVLNPRAHVLGPAAFYRKRFARILPAMLVWHLVYVVFVRAYLYGESLTVRSLGAMFFESRFFTALYFLWLIAGLYVIAPVLAAFLKDGGQRRASITAGVALAWTVFAIMTPKLSQLVGAPQAYDLGSLNMWLPYVGYFVAGWALRDVVLGRWGTFAAMAVALGALAEITWQAGAHPDVPLLWALLPVDYVGPVTVIAAVCIFVVGINVGARLGLPPQARRALVALSDASFGVFLVHLLLLVLLRRYVPAVEQAASLDVALAAYAIVLTGSFAISIAASRVRYVRAIF
jgi:surface polysaccharide O-acyltransferase-like enzyme